MPTITDRPITAYMIEKALNRDTHSRQPVVGDDTRPTHPSMQKALLSALVGTPVPNHTASFLAGRFTIRPTV